RRAGRGGAGVPGHGASRAAPRESLAPARAGPPLRMSAGRPGTRKTPERWQRLQQLFDPAARVAPGERRTFPARGRPDHPELRRQVESLLLYGSETGPLGDIVQDALADASGELGASLVGQHVGVYRLERELGEGGMGAVYLAVRADEEYRKEVAVK